jgi:hypothetical protein
MTSRGEKRLWCVWNEFHEAIVIPRRAVASRAIDGLYLMLWRRVCDWKWQPTQVLVRCCVQSTSLGSDRASRDAGGAPPQAGTKRL